jgi:tetratricopeptide (TPR) repeat protein
MALAICATSAHILAANTPLLHFAEPWPVGARDGPLIRRAASLLSEAHYLEAIPLLQEALEIQRNISGAELQAAETSSMIGFALTELRRAEEAEAYHRATLQTVHRLVGKKHWAAATALKGLADLYAVRQDFDQAESAYSQAITILEQTAAQPVLLPMTMLNFANALIARGEDRKAQSVVRRSLPLLEGLGDLGRLGKGSAKVMLAISEYHRGRLEQALALATEGLPDLEATLGPNHLQVGTLVLHIGRINMRRKEFVQAELMLSRALQIHEAFLGADHPKTATVRREYLAALRKTGDTANTHGFRSRMQASAGGSGR